MKAFKSISTASGTQEILEVNMSILPKNVLSSVNQSVSKNSK